MLTVTKISHDQVIKLVDDLYVLILVLLKKSGNTLPVQSVLQEGVEMPIFRWWLLDAYLLEIQWYQGPTSTRS